MPSAYAAPAASTAASTPAPSSPAPSREPLRAWQIFAVGVLTPVLLLVDAFTFVALSDSAAGPGANTCHATVGATAEGTVHLLLWAVGAVLPLGLLALCRRSTGLVVLWAAAQAVTLVIAVHAIQAVPHFLCFE